MVVVSKKVGLVIIMQTVMMEVTRNSHCVVSTLYMKAFSYSLIIFFIDFMFTKLQWRPCQCIKVQCTGDIVLINDNEGEKEVQS